MDVAENCTVSHLYHNYWHWFQFWERNHSIMLRRSLVFAFHFTFRHLLCKLTNMNHFLGTFFDRSIL